MAPRVDSYDFGRIVVDGKEYAADLIISPTGVVEGWWRKESHNLVPEDLLEVVAVHPMVLVVGTGADGIMKVPPATVAALEKRGIQVEIYATARAVARYNELARQGESVAAALHLTC